jgi:LuxR family maltose regulon positive regulatory protein
VSIGNAQPLRANTVSTHIRNIYAKLGADDRSAAVQQARQLCLPSGTGH